MPLPIWVLKLDLMVVCWTISGQTDIGGVIQDHKCNVPEPSPSELGRFGYCDKAPSISGCQLLPSGEGFGHFYLESFAFEDDYMMCCIFSPFKRFGFPSVWKPRFATQMADKRQKEEPLCWLCLLGTPSSFRALRFRRSQIIKYLLLFILVMYIGFSFMES